jgi:SAM-dependent methyltransferase
MKLNMGCGYSKQQGFINVDASSECAPDVVLDLEKTPWPWPSDSADTVTFFHSLEHMGGDHRVFKEIIQELYRVCSNGAEIVIRVPHPRHDDFVTDPTHVRVITPLTLDHFSKRKNAHWIQTGDPNTPLALYWGVDFEVKKVTNALDEPYRSQHKRGELSNEQIYALARERNNVIKEIEIILACRK